MLLPPLLPRLEGLFLCVGSGHTARSGLCDRLAVAMSMARPVRVRHCHPGDALGKGLGMGFQDLTFEPSVAPL